MGAKFRAKDRQRIRRIMAALPDAVDAEIVALYQRHGPAILAKARSEVPVRTGKLRSLLAFKIMPATATKSARFRMGLLTKAVQRKVWYARILEYGRKAQIAKARRNGGNPYSVKVQAIPAGRYDFVRGRTLQFMMQTLGRDLKTVLRRALQDAARGA